MFVYFLKTVRGGSRLKIGKANDPVARMRSLQTGSPQGFRLICALKCRDEAHALRVEKALHERFAGNRIHGEWFMGRDYVIREVGDLLNSYMSANGPVKTYTEQELLSMK